MKILVILFTFLFNPAVNNMNKPSLVEIRNLLMQAAESKKANTQLKAALAQYPDNNMVIKGYRGVSTMIEAKHMFNPMSRWNKFKQGRAIMEEAIQSDVNNFELRYLRFAIQTSVPAVLGYSKHIEEDKKLLISQLDKVKDADLRNRTVKYLMSTKHCTPEELNKLKKWKTA
jgi:hypothetical protein